MQVKEIDKWKAFEGCVLCEQEQYSGHSGKIALPGKKDKQIVFRIVDLGIGVEESTSLRKGDRLIVGQATVSESLGFGAIKVIQRGIDGKWYSIGNVLCVLPAGTPGTDEAVKRVEGVRVDGFEARD